MPAKKTASKKPAPASPAPAPAIPNAVPALGDRVRDKITGYTGIFVGVTLWTNGCLRATIQEETHHNKKDDTDMVTVDIHQVEVITRNPKGLRPSLHPLITATFGITQVASLPSPSTTTTPTGGPMPSVPRW